MELRRIPPVEEILGPSPGQLLRRRIFGHKGFMIGGIVVAVIILLALLAPVLSPHDPYTQSLTTRLAKPFWHGEGTWSHPLGKDHVGRDYLSRLLYGARISLLIGFCVALISGVIGTALGIVGGYFGGRVDMVITFIITLRLSIPFVLVAVAVVGLVGGSLEVVIIVLGLLLWNRYAVVMRSATQQIRNQDYVPAAEAVGCSTLRILLSEIIPNIVNNLVVVATLEMANAILLEAALSFLGMGVQPPMPSWGLMVSEGKDFLFFEPWLITIPGVALFVLVLAINLLGDGIRDVSAPENR
jgi:peptide/nickel transport system permease protein